MQIDPSTRKPRVYYEIDTSNISPEKVKKCLEQIQKEIRTDQVVADYDRAMKGI